MSQIFGRWTNSTYRLVLIGGILCILGSVPIGWVVWHAPWKTQVGKPAEQPVPFSHKHHVSDVGLDCRYCHASVEHAAFASMPPIKTCMTCHSLIWSQSPMLEPIREAWRTGMPVHWKRVTKLPDFVFFNHSIHVQKGIGCDSCHGRVDQMPLTWQAKTMHMRWCLDCHTHPERYVRPRQDVFRLDWHPPANQAEIGPLLVKRYGIDSKRITDCITCHR